MNQFEHVMVDLETYGIGHDAVIRSIGVAYFNLIGPVEAGMHIGVDIESCLLAGLKLDQSTVEFWRNQPKENIDKLLSLEKMSLICALELFNNDCLNSVDQEKACIWSHGSMFDIVILESAYKAVGVKPWWKYKNVRDTRTYFAMMAYEYKAKGGHNALEDAVNQAQAVIAAGRMSHLVRVVEEKGATYPY